MLIVFQYSLALIITSISLEVSLKVLYKSADHGKAALEPV